MRLTDCAPVGGRVEVVFSGMTPFIGDRPGEVIGAYNDPQRLIRDATALLAAALQALGTAD